MKFLLINTNQIVQKLVEITAKKAGADLTTIKELDESENLEPYHYIIIDDDCLGSDRKQAILETLENKRKCLIHNKQDVRIEGFNDYIQKPFLPTSILDIFTAQLQRESHEYASETPYSIEQYDENQKMDSTLDLDNLDEGLEKIHTLLDENIDLEKSTEEFSSLEESTESTPEYTAEGENLQETVLEPTTESTESTEELMPDNDAKELGDSQNIEDSELANIDEDINLNLESSDIEASDIKSDLDIESEALLADLPGDGLDGEDLGDSILDANLDEELDALNNTDLDGVDLGDAELNDTELNEINAEQKDGANAEPLEADQGDFSYELDSTDSTNEYGVNTGEFSSLEESNTESIPDDLIPDSMGDADFNSLDEIQGLDELGATEETKTSPNVETTENLQAHEAKTNEAQSDDTQSDFLSENGESEFSLDSELDDLPPSILDSEQIYEVSQALNALESTLSQESPASETKPQADSQNDFSSLNEPEIAQALGEEFAIPEEQNLAGLADSQENINAIDQHIATPQLSTLETDVVKNIIASSVQNSISSLSSGNLKSMLDGLEVTINISFKDKSK